MKVRTTMMTVSFGLLVSMHAAQAQDPTAPPAPESPAAPSTGRPVDPMPSDVPSANVPPATTTQPPPATVTPPETTTPIETTPPEATTPSQTTTETTTTETTTVPPAPVVPVEPESSRYNYSPQLVRAGGALLLGGGFEDFSNSNLRSMTGGGGSWDVRVVGGTRQYMGIEAAYIGAARSINTLGLASNSNLVSNGVEGALRVNIPIVAGPSLVEPFGFVGLGWQHYSITNASTNTSDLATKDDVMTVPYGGGLEVAYRHFMLDGRFTYRQTYFNDMLRAMGGKLNNWGVGGNVGVEF